MNEKQIKLLGEKEFGSEPLEIIRKTVGICNEVYELVYPDQNVILRMNRIKQFLYGTHTHLPIFKKLGIKTPIILTEDYSQSVFPFCYQFQNKIEGKDMGLVIHTLSTLELKEIAKEISYIMDQFHRLNESEELFAMTGYPKESTKSVYEEIHQQRAGIIERTQINHVIDEELMDLYDDVFYSYKNYFKQVEPKVYYDDLNFKNVMIHEGKFSGLVDLDFLLRGDYLASIGCIEASWYGESYGEMYTQEIIKLQGLDTFQQKIVHVYAILNLVMWLSSTGIRHNGNTTGEVNWERVKERKGQILALYDSLDR